MERRRAIRAGIGAIAVWFAVAGLPSGGAAQADGSVPTNFQLEHFRPAPAQETEMLGVSTSDVLPHLRPTAGLFVHMADDPLKVVEREDGREQVSSLIEQQWTAEMAFGLGLFERFELGAALPLVFQRGRALVEADGSFRALPGATFADLRLVPKWQAVAPSGPEHVGLGVAMPVSLPVGDPESYNSSGAVRLAPRVLADWRPVTQGPLAGTRLAVNVGYEIRPERVALDRVSDDAVTWAFGLRVPTGLEDLDAVANVLGETPAAIGTSPEANAADALTSVEVVGALRAEAVDQLVLQVGGGSGLTGAVGSPEFRVLAAVEYVPASGPAPSEMASVDSDFCRERVGGPCRGTDRDGDGIPDAQDECPDAPEDADGFQDADGCPDEDNDGDGVADGEDRCPNVPGIAEHGGCPMLDADGDGVLDREDGAPYEPEDFDGYRDGDGVPDPDNDGDGLADLEDECPGEPETINGVDDGDGCPDEGESKVAVTEGKIDVDDRIYFDSDRATIKQRSFSILEQVAAMLEAHPEIRKVRVEGHTDARGEDLYNLALSQRRANAVRAFLIDRGVDKSRLEAQGYGESEPIATNETAEGRRKNRRVEIRILSAEEGGDE